MAASSQSHKIYLQTFDQRERLVQSTTLTEESDCRLKNKQQSPKSHVYHVDLEVLTRRHKRQISLNGGKYDIFLT